MTAETSEPAGAELARRLIDDIWSEGNLEAIDEVVTEDYVDYWEGEAHVEGRDEFEEYVRGFRESFPDFGKEIKELVVDGDTVALRFMATGTHEAEYEGIEPTGTEISFAGSIFVHVEDGQITATYESADTWGLMEQLGVV